MLCGDPGTGCLCSLKGSSGPRRDRASSLALRGKKNGLRPLPCPGGCSPGLNGSTCAEPKVLTDQLGRPLAPLTGRRQRDLDGVACEGKRPSQELASPLLPLRACGAGAPASVGGTLWRQLATGKDEQAPIQLPPSRVSSCYCLSPPSVPRGGPVPGLRVGAPGVGKSQAAGTTPSPDPAPMGCPLPVVPAC